MQTYPRTYTLSVSAVVDFDETDPTAPAPKSVYLKGGELLTHEVAIGLANAALRSWGGYRYEAVVDMSLEVENGDLAFGVVDHEAPRPIVPATVYRVRKVLRDGGIFAKDVRVREGARGETVIATPTDPRTRQAQEMSRRVATLLANDWHDVDLKVGATVVRVTGREDRD